MSLRRHLGKLNWGFQGITQGQVTESCSKQCIGEPQPKNSILSPDGAVLWARGMGDLREL